MGRRRTDGTGVEPPEGGGEAGADDPARRAADLFARMARFQPHHRQGLELGLADLRLLWPGGGPYRVAPSAEGRRQFEAHVAGSLGTYRGALEAMGAADATRFLALLDAFTEAYGEIVQDDRPLAPDPGRE